MVYKNYIIAMLNRFSKTTNYSNSKVSIERTEQNQL